MKVDSVPSGVFAADQYPALERSRESVAHRVDLPKDHAKRPEVLKAIAPGPVAPASPVGVVVPEVPPGARAQVEHERLRIAPDVAKITPLAPQLSTGGILGVETERAKGHRPDAQ
jgi:hypothetical protein